MRMETRIALANVKYYKRKNILTGISIFLATLLLFLVPTVGYGLIKASLPLLTRYILHGMLFSEIFQKKPLKNLPHII